MANGGGGARASDAERQKVIELLRHHTGAGRLTLDEFAERAGDVYAAVTREDLAQVVVDLPEGVRPDVGPTATTAATATAPIVPTDASPTAGSPASRRRRFVAIMGSSGNRGRWRAPDEMSAFAFWGAVDIDLRNALIDSPVVEIRAWAIMGSVEVVVPPGIPVEMNGLVVMGSSDSRAHAEEAIPGAPLVRIHARGLWGSVVARNPRRRRQRRSRREEDGARSARGHRHRHHQRDQIHDDVHRLVTDAMGVARGAVDRALGTGSLSDRIPETPRTAAPAGAATGASESTPAPAPSGVTVPADADPEASGSSVIDLATTDAVSANGAAPVGRIPSGTLTILVSDIADSTRMTEQLGDQDWIKILEAHNEIVRQQVAGHGGTEVKAQGDGFLFVFPSARAAVLAAIGVQQAMASYRRDNPDAPIDLRVGLHTGEVIATDDDVFGHNVVVASRIAGTAAPGEIVVSGLTRDLTASASDLGYDDGVDVSLKGVSRPWRVHRVRWSEP
jgi:class 3 adenylate cyclase